MILQTASILTTLGFATWLIGLLLEYRGVAVIGATIIVGIGAVVIDDGLQERAGEVERTTANNTTEIDYQYREVETPMNLNLGTIITLLGGVLALHGINDAGGT